MSFKFIDVILADAAPAAPAPAGPPDMLKMLPIYVLMFAVLYLFLIRPQSKKAKEHAKLLSTLKPGDKVATSSGIVGVVVSVKEKTVAIRSVETKLEVLKSAVSEITERSGEAAESEPSKS